MYVYLSKILPLFLMPLSISLFFAIIGLFLLRRGLQRVATVLLAIAVAGLWVASMPIVASGLYRSLESTHLPVPSGQVKEGGCIIVLGGVVEAAIPPRVDTELNEAVDRVYKAASLFRSGKAPYVIVTGGNQPWTQSGVAEAELIRELLVEWGVPADTIFLEGSSRNTRENALYTKNIIDAIHCEQPLLVTSAAHMARAVAAFSSVGVAVTPVSADVRVTKQGLPSVLEFLPSAEALAMTSAAIREWIGLKVYEWNGWN